MRITPQRPRQLTIWHRSRKSAGRQVVFPSQSDPIAPALYCAALTTFEMTHRSSTKLVQPDVSVTAPPLTALPTVGSWWLLRTMQPTILPAAHMTPIWVNCSTMESTSVPLTMLTAPLDQPVPEATEPRTTTLLHDWPFCRVSGLLLVACSTVVWSPPPIRAMDAFHWLMSSFARSSVCPALR